MSCGFFKIYNTQIIVNTHFSNKTQQLTSVLIATFNVFVITRKEFLDDVVQTRIVAPQFCTSVHVVVDAIRWICITLHVKVGLNTFSLNRKNVPDFDFDAS